MDRKRCFRGAFYLAGMMILALGLTLNTQTGLGVSPINSVPFCASKILSISYGNASFIVYCLFIALQLLLRDRRAYPSILLQLPLSLLFTRMLDLCVALLPVSLDTLWQNTLLLIIALILSGIGAAMMLVTRLIPTPGDGIVQTIADRLGIETGLAKNGFDVLSVAVTFTLGAVSGNFLYGIGLGTLLAMVLVGRVIALFNRLFKARIQRLCGLNA